MGNINASVDLHREGGIAIVTADNPPVNALKYEVRAGLVAALSQARDDNAVEAVVIAWLAGEGLQVLNAQWARWL